VLTIAPADLSSPEVVALIALLDAELSERYPEPGANHFRLDGDDVGAGRGALLIARWGDEVVGCGAVRVLDPGTAEIKRMFTLPEARGRGVGRALLVGLERAARELGVTRLVLETGTRQHEALGLYQSHGFRVIPLFGEYLDSPDTSVCMAKNLDG